jgi:hypothetical protein
MSGKRVKFDKLSEKDQRIVWHANDMLWLWRDLNNRDPDGRGFYELKARQAYHDALLSLKHNGLIDDYDCLEVRTSINGNWYSERRSCKFVQTGPSVPVF